jgi:hypothetical protein
MIVCVFELSVQPLEAVHDEIYHLSLRYEKLDPEQLDLYLINWTDPKAIYT